MFRRFLLFNFLLLVTWLFVLIWLLFAARVFWFVLVCIILLGWVCYFFGLFWMVFSEFCLLYCWCNLLFYLLGFVSTLFVCVGLGCSLCLLCSGDVVVCLNVVFGYCWYGAVVVCCLLFVLVWLLLFWLLIWWVVALFRWFACFDLGLMFSA